jgi:hypothetical protein
MLTYAGVCWRMLNCCGPNLSNAQVKLDANATAQVQELKSSQVLSFLACFTGTKVQILTPEALRARRRAMQRTRRRCRRLRMASRLTRPTSDRRSGTQFTCFTGTKGQILTRCAVVVSTTRSGRQWSATRRHKLLSRRFCVLIYI